MKLNKIEIYPNIVYDMAYESIHFNQTIHLKLENLLNSGFMTSIGPGYYFIYKNPLLIRNYLKFQSTLFIGVI